jgi:anaerobic magnesium-protoporphyrin IX monomethyl ester cyclase
LRVALLLPPATDVRSPQLAVPSIAAYLRANSVEVIVRDLNLEGLLWLLDAGRLTSALNELQRSTAPTAPGDTRRHPILRHGDFVVGHVPQALVDLRDSVAFYDPHRYHLARSSLLAACELISACHPRVTYSFSNAVYRVEGIDPSRLDDLSTATSDPSLNLFDMFYRESVLPQLATAQPDVIGISILNGQQILPGLMLARLLKGCGHFVVIGGTVYSKFVRELLRRPQFLKLFCDGLFPYEGETALLALLHTLNDRRDLAAVPNLIFLDRHGQLSMGPTHVEDVDSLPTPDFGDLPLSQYLTPAPVLPILLGKGCYFNRCKFCDIPFINSVSDKAYRVRSVRRVAEDIATLQQRHGARCFEFTDETLSPRSLVALGDALAERGVEARFVGYARFERGFTPQACSQIYEMGMRKLFFGLESGNQDTLNHMRKGLRVDTARLVLRNCVDAGIGCHVFSIIGFPEEPESSARDTLKFFLDEADTLDQPMNTFDIHAFGLDLRTAYGDDPDRYGIEIDRSHLDERDFPISVMRWRNIRGLNNESVERLLAEFGQLLRKRFRNYQNYPDSLWPGFEEYSVLYADHYDDRPFPYRFSLPPAGDSSEFSLVWAPDIQVNEGDPYVISTLAGTVTVGNTALLVLATPLPAMPVNDLLGRLASWFDVSPRQTPALVADLRAVVDRLLAIRALCLVPAEDIVGMRLDNDRRPSSKHIGRQAIVR